MDISNPTTLSELERRTCVFLRSYEDCRRSTVQGWYQAVKDGLVQDSLWKQSLTVVEWLISQHLQVSWTEVTWKGYISFCFQKLSPTIPVPGQLKNKLLLREFLRNGYTEEKPIPVRSEDDLEALYRRVLRKEIVQSPALSKVLGVRRV